MRYYQTEVITKLLRDSDAEARQILRQTAARMEELGGTLQAGWGYGDTPAILLMSLPDDSEVKPEDVVNNVDWHKVYRVDVPIPYE